MIGVASFLMAATSVSPGGDGIAWDYRFDCNDEGTQTREGVPAIELPSEQWVIEFSENSLLAGPDERESAILSVMGSGRTSTVRLALRSWYQASALYRSDKPDHVWAFEVRWKPMHYGETELKSITVSEEKGAYLLKAMGTRDGTTSHGPPVSSLSYKGTCNLMAGHSA